MPLSELASSLRCAGLNSVLRNIAKGRVLKVFLAQDADEKLSSKVKDASLKQAIPVEMAADSQQLGRACALPRKTAVAAVLKE